MSEKIITRIAPSPTGNLHVGTARTALFNFLFARKHNGTYIVRIEDTDKARSTKEYEKDILDGLTWLGLNHDELYRQSENTNRYTEVLQKLLETDAAYVSNEPAKDDPNREVAVIRLRNPGKIISFTDLVRGDISFDTTELGDFVIARSTDDPLYHLTVVVDDYDMNISHVIRGEDHISNTPRQILIQEALGFARPQYAHLPLILAPDRSKLSKRKGETSISAYAQEFLPEAITNYLALLGWNPGTEQEVFTLQELVECFSIEKIQKGGAIFDIEKLKSLNAQHLKKVGGSEFERRIIDALSQEVKDSPYYTPERVRMTVPIVRERVRTYKEIEGMVAEGELDYYFLAPTTIDPDAMLWKDETKETTKEHLETLVTLLEQLSAVSFTEETIKEAVWPYAEEKGKGNVLWPLRYALSGKDKSPAPFTIAKIIGKEATLKRIQSAIDILN